MKNANGETAGMGVRFKPDPVSGLITDRGASHYSMPGFREWVLRRFELHFSRARLVAAAFVGA
jgi:hypothetical protein